MPLASVKPFCSTRKTDGGTLSIKAHVADAIADAEHLTFADMSLDPQTREVTRGGRRISLTRTEFALLQTFMENPRRVLERNWLLNEVWGFDFEGEAERRGRSTAVKGWGFTEVEGGVSATGPSALARFSAPAMQSL